MRRAALLATLAGLALVAAACGERSEPTGRTVALYPVSVSRSGASPIVLDSAPARVAVIGPSAAAIVAGIEQGRTDGPKILRMNEVGADELRAFKPDLVIASGDIDQSALDRAAGAATSPVYAVPDSSIGDVEQGIVDTGTLLGRELQARTLVDRIRAQRASVRQKVEGLPPIRTFADTGFYITVPPDSLVGDLVREAGGVPVGGKNDPGSPVDLGMLKRLDPGFYLATSDSGITLRDLRKNRRTSTLRAVRTGHFGIVPASLLQASPEIGDGLVAIARLLHPDAFG